LAKIATGKSHSVYEFVVNVLRCLDPIPAGANPPDVVNGYVEVDPKLFRTGEIHDLVGDPTLAREGRKAQLETGSLLFRAWFA
jgi:GDP-D-mannose dehydratase